MKLKKLSTKYYPIFFIVLALFLISIFHFNLFSITGEHTITVKTTPGNAEVYLQKCEETDDAFRVCQTLESKISDENGIATFSVPEGKWTIMVKKKCWSGESNTNYVSSDWTIPVVLREGIGMYINTTPNNADITIKGQGNDFTWVGSSGDWGAIVGGMPCGTFNVTATKGDMYCNIVITSEYGEDLFLILEEDPPDPITCYRCEGKNNCVPNSSVFFADECPPGWVEEIPADCGCVDCYQCQNNTVVRERYPQCPTGWYKTEPNCNPDNMVTCYQCQNDSLVNQDFVDECPDGWSEYPPSCLLKPNPAPGYEITVLLIAIGSAYLLLKRRKE